MTLFRRVNGSCTGDDIGGGTGGDTEFVTGGDTEFVTGRDIGGDIRGDTGSGNHLSPLVGTPIVLREAIG